MTRNYMGGRYLSAPDRAKYRRNQRNMKLVVLTAALCIISTIVSLMIFGISSPETKEPTNITYTMPSASDVAVNS